MKIKEKLKHEVLFFDGAMGTSIQNTGVKVDHIPEELNILYPETIKQIHKEYLEAGSDIITTNTFGANRYKVEKTPYTIEQIVQSGVEIARGAVDEHGAGYVALDIGSTGQLIEPIGEITEEEIYDVFKEIAVVGEKNGCDLIIIETFVDIVELEVAIRAAKENTNLPIIATMSFDAGGRTAFGVSIPQMVEKLTDLNVDALGINCSLGPKQLVPMVDELVEESKLPIIVQPNAGLPVMKDGKSVYDVTEDEFASYMKEFNQKGVTILGGCCGTTPRYIQKVISETRK